MSGSRQRPLIFFRGEINAAVSMVPVNQQEELCLLPWLRAARNAYMPGTRSPAFKIVTPAWGPGWLQRHNATLPGTCDRAGTAADAGCHLPHPLKTMNKPQGRQANATSALQPLDIQTFQKFLKINLEIINTVHYICTVNFFNGHYRKKREREGRNAAAYRRCGNRNVRCGGI